MLFFLSLQESLTNTALRQAVLSSGPSYLGLWVSVGILHGSRKPSRQNGNLKKLPLFRRSWCRIPTPAQWSLRQPGSTENPRGTSIQRANPLLHPIWRGIAPSCCPQQRAQLPRLKC